MTTPQPPEYCLLSIDSWATCMQKSEWASWAQAVFSVVSIIAAIWVVHRQHKLERNRSADEQTDRDERLLQVALHCVETAQKLVQRIGLKRQGPGQESPADRRRQLSDVGALRVQIDSLPLIELPTATSINYVARLITLVQQAEGLIPFGGPNVANADILAADCNEDYAAPWLPLRGELGDLHAYLEWEIVRLSDPDVPHPAG